MAVQMIKKGGVSPISASKSRTWNKTSGFNVLTCVFLLQVLIMLANASSPQNGVQRKNLTERVKNAMTVIVGTVMTTEGYQVGNNILIKVICTVKEPKGLHIGNTINITVTDEDKQTTHVSELVPNRTLMIMLCKEEQIYRLDYVNGQTPIVEPKTKPAQVIIDKFCVNNTDITTVLGNGADRDTTTVLANHANGVSCNLQSGYRLILAITPIWMAAFLSPGTNM